MKRFLLPVFFSLFFVSCRFNNKRNAEKEKAEEIPFSSRIDLLKADREFSALSEEKGLRNAYTEFIDSNGVLLRAGTLPLTGGNAMDFITQSNDTAYQMKWEPQNASIAKSGELGFTYGVYSLTNKKTDSVIYGTYVTIWKKQPDGHWKFVLQSGNEGVGE